MTLILGPLPCSACRRDVTWDRVGRDWRLLEPVGRTWRAHRCRRPRLRRPGPLCGAWMPIAGEPCARLAGHADSHRSRYDLDNQIRARRSGWAA